MRILTALIPLVVVLSLEPAEAGPPPPALPPNTIGTEARAEMYLQFTDILSQALGGHVLLRDVRVYTEQDGATTLCTRGILDGRPFRLIQGQDKDGQAKIVTHPTNAQWIEGGCTRPNYLFIG